MNYVSDFHLHSKYSRAVSKDMILPSMARVAKQKGINILSACDWTHTLWFKEIKEQLVEASDGLYKIKSENENSEDSEPLFILATEISSIYSEKGKLRRIHNLIFAPSLETAEKINKELIKRGCNLMADGRPIVGISSKNLLSLILEIDERSMLIPCHVWTPHFGMYGSASGYDSLEEAFEDLTPHIYGIETGLSSDPEMNWQIPELMNRSILSFSDAHSLPKMGRELTIFELENPTYEHIRQAIMRNSKKTTDPLRSEASYGLQSTAAVASRQSTVDRIVYTLEFYPEEGKYHFSGHRNCGIVRGPEETRKEGNTCPKCSRRLTEGVLYRVQQLADDSLLDRVEQKISPHGIKWYTDKRKNHPPFIKMVPLLEIIAESLGSTSFSVKSKALYDRLCVVESTKIGSELDILLKIPLETIRKAGGDKLTDAIEKVRSGDILVDPGYDGEYGKVNIWNHGSVNSEEGVGNLLGKRDDPKEQLGLF